MNMILAVMGTSSLKHWVRVAKNVRSERNATCKQCNWSSVTIVDAVSQRCVTHKTSILRFSCPNKLDLKTGFSQADVDIIPTADVRFVEVSHLHPGTALNHFCSKRIAEFCDLLLLQHNAYKYFWLASPSSQSVIRRQLIFGWLWIRREVDCRNGFCKHSVGSQISASTGLYHYFLAILIMV